MPLIFHGRHFNRKHKLYKTIQNDQKLFGKLAVMLMTLVMSVIVLGQQGYEPIRGWE